MTRSCRAPKGMLRREAVYLSKPRPPMMRGPKVLGIFSEVFWFHSTWTSGGLLTW